MDESLFPAIRRRADGSIDTGHHMVRGADARVRAIGVAIRAGLWRLAALWSLWRRWRLPRGG